MVESSKEDTIGKPSGSKKFNLHIQGRKLRDLDVISKSDPQCLVYEKKGEQWVKIGETEHIDNDLNPNFKTPITIEYHFEKMQKLKFVMHDIDDDDNYDVIGDIETTLGAVLHSRNQMFMDRLQFEGKENKIGVIMVRGEAVEETN